MYLGELVRLVTEDLYKEGLIFKGLSTAKLSEPNSISSQNISNIESDPVGVFYKTKEFLTEYGITNVKDYDLPNFRYVCELISKRSAFCISAAMACLIEKVDEPFCVIGVDGALFSHHPHYAKLMKSKIRELLHPRYNVSVRIMFKYNHCVLFLVFFFFSLNL